MPQRPQAPQDRPRSPTQHWQPPQDGDQNRDGEAEKCFQQATQIRAVGVGVEMTDRPMASATRRSSAGGRASLFGEGVRAGLKDARAIAYNWLGCVEDVFRDDVWRLEERNRMAGYALS